MLEDDLFIAIRDCVVRIRKSDGLEVWRTKLPKRPSTLVTIAVERDGLYASSAGELYRLDPKTGTILWTNKLPKLGHGAALIATAIDDGEGT